jgi:DNA helicase-2/ATP-dependent DNA helicase PcrA
MNLQQMKNVHIKAVIFDMDGLMIDTEKLYAIFWEKALLFYGYHATKDLLLSLRSLSRELASELFKKSFGEEVDYIKIRKKRIELMNAYIDEYGIEKKKGLDEILDYLWCNNVRMAVATATDFERTDQYLTQLGIKKYFEHIVCGSMVAHGKPAPDIYLKAVNLLDVVANECIALEDSPNGVTAAYRAGCNVIMVPEYDENSIDEDICYHKADDLMSVIKIIKEEWVL